MKAANDLEYLAAEYLGEIPESVKKNFREALELAKKRIGRRLHVVIWKKVVEYYQMDIEDYIAHPEDWDVEDWAENFEVKAREYSEFISELKLQEKPDLSHTGSPTYTKCFDKQVNLMEFMFENVDFEIDWTDGTIYFPLRPTSRIKWGVLCEEWNRGRYKLYADDKPTNPKALKVWYYSTCKKYEVVEKALRILNEMELPPDCGRIAEILKSNGTMERQNLVRLASARGFGKRTIISALKGCVEAGVFSEEKRDGKTFYSYIWDGGNAFTVRTPKGIEFTTDGDAEGDVSKPREYTE